MINFIDRISDIIQQIRRSLFVIYNFLFLQKYIMI